MILMLANSSLTLFLSTENFKANGVDYFFIRACGRRHARKTCFCPNSLNFYRFKIILSVFWDAEKNPTRETCLFSSDVATFAVADVFTNRRLLCRGQILPCVCASFDFTNMFNLNNLF